MNITNDIQFDTNLIGNEIANLKYNGYLYKNGSDSVTLVYGYDDDWKNTTEKVMTKTDDGFVWIGQYSGLTRYDSDEYVTYKSFNENGTEYSIINIRGLAADQNTLYVATHKNIFAYKDYQFS